MARNFTFADDEYMYHPKGVVSEAPLTWMVWFRKNNPSESVCLISLGSATGKQFRLQSYATEVEQEARDGNTASAAASFTPTADTWYWVGGIEYATNSRKVFAPEGTTGTDSVSKTIDNLIETRLGSRTVAGSDDTMDGMIAHAAVWNVALSDEEMNILRKGAWPKMIRPSNLVAYWPLDGKQMPEPDTSLGQNHYMIPQGSIEAFPSPKINIPIPVDPLRLFIPEGAAPASNARSFVPAIIGG